MNFLENTLYVLVTIFVLLIILSLAAALTLAGVEFLYWFFTGEFFHILPQAQQAW